MSRVLKGLAVACAVLAIGASAHAEGGLVTSQDMSLEMAKGIAEAALAECRNKGFHTAVVVVDRGADVLVSLRDEQATPQVAEMARRKAYTALTFASRWATSLEAAKNWPDLLRLTDAWVEAEPGNPDPQNFRDKALNAPFNGNRE